MQSISSGGKSTVVTYFIKTESIHRGGIEPPTYWV
jgi:hypothetical protein